MSKRNFDEISFSQGTDYSGSSKRQNTYPVRMPTVHKVKFTNTKKAVAKSKVGKKTSFAEEVKKVLRRTAEKKQIDSGLGLTYFGSAATNSQLVVGLSPNAGTLAISQGSGVNQRTGNRVRVKRAIFKGQIFPAVHNASFNAIPEPQNVKFYFLSSKTDPNEQVTPLVSPFYRSGATTSAMAGLGSDPYFQIDHESLTVYYEKLYKVGYSRFGTTGTLTAADGWANNDVPIIQRFEFDITKWLPKEFVFDDATVNPTSRALCCVIEATSALSGTAQTTTQSNTTGIVYQIHIEYTDV